MSYPTSFNATIHADDMSPRITNTPPNKHGQQIMFGGTSRIATYLTAEEAERVAVAWRRIADELSARETETAA
jgi:hypothetical protein